MRTCIVTGRYYDPHQTMINFHIENLFGGDTIVLSRGIKWSSPHGIPHHAWAVDGKYRDQGAFGLVSASVNRVRYLTSGVPQGGVRAEIMRFLVAHKPRVALVELGKVALRIAPVLRDAGVPYFVYFRGSDATKHLAEPFQAAAYRKMLASACGIFCVSHYLAESLERRGVSHPNCFIVPSGVDTSLFFPGKKMPYSFLIVGRLVEKKRPDISVHAFCLAARMQPQARLRIIGDGPYLGRCREVAVRFGIGDRVEFMGFQDHGVVREWMAKSEVFLQHSVVSRSGNAEGLPTAIQEAMASGAVVLSTKHAGIPEAVVDGQTGFLVDEGDLDAFVGRIRFALENRDALSKMAVLARSVAREKFDNKRLIRVVEEKIEHSLYGRRTCSGEPF